MAFVVGKAAPAFELDAVHKGQFTRLSLNDFKGKWLIVFFYPLDFTFVCPTEIIAFSDAYEQFRKLGADVVGVSIDSKYCHLAWTQTARKNGGIEGMTFPLLADLNRQMASDYGVLNSDGVALRGLFIIDPDGVIQHATVNNSGVGRSVEETLRTLQAFQFVREHGEVCPANWHPGSSTIKPDVSKSKDYFAHAAEAALQG